MLPESVPNFSVGPLIGFVSNGVLTVFCLIVFFVYRYYRPLWSLLLFYLFITLSFWGWMIYGLQTSSESILLGNRVQYAGLSLLPGTWIWFYLSLFNKKPGLTAWIMSGISLILAALAIFGTGPWLFGVPLTQDPLMGGLFLRPESRFLKPMVLSFCLGACLFYLILIVIRLYRSKGLPIHIISLLLGLVAWLLGGIHDALRFLGVTVLSQSYVLWFASLWLSLFLTIATMLHFRNMENVVREELERLNRAKSRVLEHLSHELITPTSLIHGSILVLKRKLQGQSQLQSEDLLNIIEAQTDRLKKIQNDTMKIIRSYQNLDDVTFEPISLLPFTKEWIEKIKEYSSHRDIHFHLDGTSSDLRLSMVRQVLGDILEALLKNAVENTPDQGTIQVSWEEDGDKILLKVQDFGTGITKEDQEHIFEGFFHARETELYASRKPYDFNAGGKGLDLLRMKAYGQRFGFDLSLDSRRCPHLPTDRDLCPGMISACVHCQRPEDCQSSGGSTFCLTFPHLGERYDEKAFGKNAPGG